MSVCVRRRRCLPHMPPRLMPASMRRGLRVGASRCARCRSRRPSSTDTRASRVPIRLRSSTSPCACSTTPRAISTRAPTRRSWRTAASTLKTRTCATTAIRSTGTSASSAAPCCTTARRAMSRRGAFRRRQKRHSARWRLATATTSRSSPTSPATARRPGASTRARTTTCSVRPPSGS